MADQIHLHFPDNFGRAPLELLESDVSINARMCFVVMTSFGKESRAGKESIRKRMGVASLSTVKAAQKELIEAGWIEIRVKGGADGITPTIWDVWAKPFNGQLDLLPGRITPPASQREGGGRITAPKQELLNQESNSNPPEGGISPWTRCLDAFKAALDAARAIRKLPPHQGRLISGRDGKALKDLLKGGISAEQFEANIKNLPFHGFAAQKGWTLWYVCQNFQEFEDGAEALKGRAGAGNGKGGSRGHIAPAAADFKPSGL